MKENFGGLSGEGNIDADPIFVRGPLGGYYLAQIAPGQVSESPCVDAGDRPMLWPCLSNPLSRMVCGTTRTDLEADRGTIDMGYHYPFKDIGFSPGRQLGTPPGNEAQVEGME